MLTILILTIPARRWFLTRLMNHLTPQLGDFRVEVLETKSHKDGGPTIGEKRQQILGKVQTPYSCYFDDDDLPSRNYCRLIRQALSKDPDVVGFRLRHFEDGNLTGLTTHSLKCETYRSELAADNLYRYYRTPNHLNPTRIEMVREISFQPVMYGEDGDYARRLYGAYGLNMREEFIDAYIYDYLYRIRKPSAPIQIHDAAGTLTREGMEETIRNGGSVVFKGRIVNKPEELC